MISVTRRAKQLGFALPVKITPRAWDNCVGWTATDTRRTGILGSQPARLLWLLYRAATMCEGVRPGAEEVFFSLKRQPRRAGDGAEALMVVRIHGKGRSTSLLIDLAPTK